MIILIRNRASTGCPSQYLSGKIYSCPKLEIFWISIFGARYKMHILFPNLMSSRCIFLNIEDRSIVVQRQNARHLLPIHAWYGGQKTHFDPVTGCSLWDANLQESCVYVRRHLWIFSSLIRMIKYIFCSVKGRPLDVHYKKENIFSVNGTSDGYAPDCDMENYKCFYSCLTSCSHTHIFREVLNFLRIVSKYMQIRNKKS